MPFKQIKVKGNQEALGYKQIRDQMLRKWEAAECNGELPSSFAPPVVVLGFPNSGSRLIANVLRSGGVDMGSRTNAMEDAMCFAPLFERYLHDDIPYHRILLQQSDAGIDEEAFARELGTAMCMHFNGKATAHPNYHPPRCLAGGGAPEAAVWGWKESRWMWLMPLLHRLMPSCTFVHVVRNGLERKASKENPDSLHGQADALQEKVLNEHAHKSAQGQVEAAGAVISALQVDERRARINAKAHGSVDPDRQILGNAEVPEDMEGVLLWDKINTLVADYGENHVTSGKYFRVKYEDVCADPAGALAPVFSSLGLEVPSKGAAWLPKTHAPRFKESDIDPALAQFVRGHIGQTLERFGY